MDRKQLPLQLGLGFALGMTGVVLGIPAAQAQTGNQSNSTGTIITTSDVAGGAFAPGGGGQLILVFETSDVRNAVDAAADSVNQQLASRDLPVVATGPQTAIPTAVQQTIECITIDSGDVEGCLSTLENALVNAGIDRTLARNLASSLRGLTAGNTVEPAQFAAVVDAYNAVISSSSAEVLRDPPEELRAIQSVLAVLLNAAFARG